MLFLRLFKHLLPDAKAWRITIDKRLRQLFAGLTGLGEDVKTFYDLIFSDIDPAQTRQLDVWEQQFGLPDTGLTEDDRRSRLDAIWKATGGQSPRYIQDTIQAAGFDAYVYEWWVPGSEAAVNVKACAVAHNPILLLQTSSGFKVYVVECGEAVAECGEITAEAGEYLSSFGYLLVNKVFTTVVAYLMECDEPLAQAGELQTDAGDFTDFAQIPIEYPVPTDPAKWPYIVYIGGPTFGSFADIAANRRDEFEALLLKYIPAQQWIGIFAEYTPVSNIYPNQLEAGDTQTGSLVKTVVSANYGWTIAALVGGAYGMGAINPNTAFWVPPDVPLITGITVTSGDIVTLTTTPPTWDFRQSRVYITVPGFSATPIQLDLGSAPYATWVSTGFLASKPTGLNAYLATQVGNTIPITINVLADVSTLGPNEHYFSPDQVTGSNTRGYEAAAQEGIAPNGPGYLAPVVFTDEPTRRPRTIQVLTAGALQVRVDTTAGLTVGTSTCAVEFEGYNWGSPLVGTWNGFVFVVATPTALHTFMVNNYGNVFKMRMTRPVI